MADIHSRIVPNIHVHKSFIYRLSIRIRTVFNRLGNCDNMLLCGKNATSLTGLYKNKVIIKLHIERIKTVPIQRKKVSWKVILKQVH